MYSIWYIDVGDCNLRHVTLSWAWFKSSLWIHWKRFTNGVSEWLSGACLHAHVGLYVLLSVSISFKLDEIKLLRIIQSTIFHEYGTFAIVRIFQPVQPYFAIELSRPSPSLKLCNFIVILQEIFINLGAFEVKFC